MFVIMPDWSLKSCGIPLHCDYDYDPHSGGGQTHRQAGKTHKKARQSGTVDHSAEVGWMGSWFLNLKVVWFCLRRPVAK